jgi:methyl-accepting chemotaxis protein
MSNKMDSIYSDSTEPLALFGKIETHVVAISADVFRSLQHNPDSDVSRIHVDHRLTDHLDKIDAQLKEIDALRGKTPIDRFGQKEKTLIAKFDRQYAVFVRDVILPTVASMRANDFSLAMQERFLLGFRQTGVPLESTITELISQLTKIANENFAQAEQTHQSSRMNMLIAFAISIIFCTFIVWKIIRSIVTPLSDLQKTMHEIEDSGNLTRRVSVTSSDEIGQTATTFNHFVDTLQRTLSEILDHTTRLDAAASDLGTSTQQAAQRSEMTSESSTAMAAAVEEMTVSVAHISQNAQETSKLTQHTGDLSQQSSEVIRQTVDEMYAVAEVVNKSSEIIAELSRQSKQISIVVQVIKEVADQTNLLALNAAIEAARTGELGRGFAVVADEVRKLAERTTNATTDISTMITSILDSSDLAVGAMNNVVERVKSGVVLADQAGEAITSIQKGTKQVQIQVNDATLVLAEQNAASQSIAEQVELVAQAAEENSAAARNASNAVKSIEQLAHTVRNEVGKFKVCALATG